MCNCKTRERTVTVHTLLIQREVVRTVLADNGGHLPIAGPNQSVRHSDITASFAHGADGTGPVGIAYTTNQHDRRFECCTFIASVTPINYSNRPKSGRRSRTSDESSTMAIRRLSRAEVSYTIHAALRQAAPPWLLAIWRWHLSLESRCH